MLEELVPSDSFVPYRHHLLVGTQTANSPAHMPELFRKDWAAVRCNALFWRLVWHTSASTVASVGFYVPFATNTFGHSSGGLPVHPRTCQLVRNNTASRLVVNEGAKTARLLEVQRWWKIRASRVQKSVANYEATCVILWSWNFWEMYILCFGRRLYSSSQLLFKFCC